MRKILIASTLAILAASAPVLASEDECTKTPKEQWLSIDQLKAKLGEQGYTVSKVEIEDACAEAEVRSRKAVRSALRQERQCRS